MRAINSFLNTTTMYRVVLYVLLALLGSAFILTSIGVISQDPLSLAFSILFILSASWLTNTLFAKVFRAQPNVESVYITAFILACIITPVAPSDLTGIGFLLFASAWASASKYIFAYSNKHLFNPAAFGVALASLTIGQSASWWAACTPALLPVTIIGGFLIVRKVQQEYLVGIFTLAALTTVTVLSPGNSLVMPSVQTLLYSSLLFFAGVMLTEPLTMPASRQMRILFAALVGTLFAPNFHLGPFYFSPEMALLVGNLFAYVVSPKSRFVLRLIETRMLADNTREFIFDGDKLPSFNAGQYIELTLAHENPDARGNRRCITIASSPTENTIRLGVKFYEPASSFKHALLSLRAGDTIVASYASGDFTLPKNPKKKLAFIAGGIGVTPFRSMVQYLVDTKDTRSVTMLYANKTAAEIAYKDVFDAAAQSIGLKTTYVLADEPAPVPGTVAGQINEAVIAQEIPDYRERIFYISGPHSMVGAISSTLRSMGVPSRNIRTDYFPGFA